MAFLIGLFLVASISNKAVASERYVCDLDGNIHGASVGFIISGEALYGRGLLKCKDQVTGQTASQYVKLSMVGAGVGFDFTIVKSMRLHAAGIETSRGLRAFRRSFSVGASAGVTVLTDGVTVDSALHVSNRSLGFDLGFIGEDAVGLGVRLQGMAFTIDPV